MNMNNNGLRNLLQESTELCHLSAAHLCVPGRETHGGEVVDLVPQDCRPVIVHLLGQKHAAEMLMISMARS